MKLGINETPSLFEQTYYIYQVALARSLCADLGRTTTGCKWLFSFQTSLISAHPQPQGDFKQKPDLMVVTPAHQRMMEDHQLKDH